MKMKNVSREKKTIVMGTKIWLCLILSLLLTVCSGCGKRDIDNSDSDSHSVNSSQSDNEDEDSYRQGQTAQGQYKEAQEQQDYELPVTIVNHTGVDIYYMYASVTQTDEWEEDILGNDYLAAGDSKDITFYFDDSHTVWDWMIKDIEGNSLEFYDLNFAGCSLSGATLILDEDGNATLY